MKNPILEQSKATKPVGVLATEDRRFLVHVVFHHEYSVFQHVGFFTEREKDPIVLLNKAVMESPGKAAVIDMTDTFIIDCFGLGDLLILNGAMANRHKALALLINGNSTVLRRLRATLIADIIPVYGNLGQCAAALAKL